MHLHKYFANPCINIDKWAEQHHYDTALQLTLERNKCPAMQIQPYLRKIERSILFPSFHLKMLEEIQNYTAWFQDVWQKSPYTKELFPLNAHNQVCHRNNSFAERTLWLEWRVEAISPVKGVQAFSLHLLTCFFLSPGVIVPESVFN